MDFVVLDTDVASLSFKRQLPPALLEHLIGKRPFITFATLGELTKWADQRNWAERRRTRLKQWLEGIPILPGTACVARAACCLAYEMPLATLNVKDFADFAEYEGLRLVGR